MSEQIIRRTGRVVDAQSAMPWLVVVGVYLLLTALGPRLLSDPDTYSHIALGRWILEHHTVPTTDPFSATLRGTHWVAFEWLSQVILAIAYAVGGWTGVVALAAAAVAAAFGVLTRFLLREWQPNAVLAAVLTAILLTAPHMLARPHILALPVMVLWIATLIRAVDTRSRSALAFGSADGAMGKSPRQLHIRTCNDRPHRVRRALAIPEVQAIERDTAMGSVHRSCIGRRVPQSLRSRNDPGDIPDSRARRGVDDRY